MASDLSNLQSIKSALLASLAMEATYQQAHGPRTTYSLDGESYSWNEWRAEIIRQVVEINKLMQQETPAFVITSRVRP